MSSAAVWLCLSGSCVVFIAHYDSKLFVGCDRFVSSRIKHDSVHRCGQSVKMVVISRCGVDVQC